MHIKRRLYREKTGKLGSMFQHLVEDKMVKYRSTFQWFTALYHMWYMSMQSLFFSEYTY
jgi:hypothetical protein